MPCPVTEDSRAGLLGFQPTCSQVIFIFLSGGLAPDGHSLYGYGKILFLLNAF